MKTKTLIALFIVAISFSSCSKDGETGPAGPAGNANVSVYNFGARTIVTSTDFLLPGLTQGKVDSSLLLGFYNPNTEAETAWYPIPGVGSTGNYDTRAFWYLSGDTFVYSVRFMKPTDGTPYTTSVGIRKARVFVVPANSIINGRGAGNVDLTDYHQVAAHYNIAE